MPSRRKQNITLADDHPVFRNGLRQIVEAESDFKVIGEACDGEKALEQIKALSPEVAILDISMPKLDGLAVADIVHEEGLPVKIVLVTMYREEKLFKKALEAGVKGYVLKDSAAIDIISCLNAVAAGENYTSPELTTYLIKRVRKVDIALTPQSSLDSLSDTERRLLSLIADCKTNKEMAQELFISVRTVETHRNNICKKLNVHGSHALMKFALDHKDHLS